MDASMYIKILLIKRLGENVGFQLAKTKLLFKSKSLYYEFVEFSSTSNFIRSTYYLPFFAVYISPFKWRLLGICPVTEVCK